MDLVSTRNFVLNVYVSLNKFLPLVAKSILEMVIAMMVLTKPNVTLMGVIVVILMQTQIIVIFVNVCQ